MGPDKSNQGIKMKADNHSKIQMLHISKGFPGVQALDDVDFEVRSGEVHAIVGENGAGKSTLIKILAGVYSKDAGEIRIDGLEVIMDSPLAARRQGISVIYQEFALVPELSVGQNIFLGNEKRGPLSFLIDKQGMNRRGRELLNSLNIDLDPKRKVGRLTVGEQQIVEIAKALAGETRFIVMDEPTSALSEEEKKNLFRIIAGLKKEGYGIVYISHRMKEIFEIADTVTVMRDGKKVGDYPVSEVNEGDVVRLMVGRELGSIYHRERLPDKGELVLKVENLTREGLFRNISFEVHEGEVLGISGLMGAGRTEIVRCIFGLDPFDSGRILLQGQEVKFRHPFDAIRNSIGFVPEDRKRLGFVPLFDVKQNLALPSLYWITRMGWIERKKQLAIGEEYSRELSIKMSSLEQKVLNLSGGNQQKVVLGKWLARNAKLLILDEPTRGIDVGAKAEIHRIISELVKENLAVIMISSELPEILGISDRIVVIHEGDLTGSFDYREATEQKIMLAATGLPVQAGA